MTDLMFDLLRAYLVDYLFSLSLIVMIQVIGFTSVIIMLGSIYRLLKDRLPDD